MKLNEYLKSIFSDRAFRHAGAMVFLGLLAGILFTGDLWEWGILVIVIVFAYLSLRSLRRS